MGYLFVLFICAVRAFVETYFVPIIPTTLEYSLHYFLFFLAFFFIHLFVLSFFLPKKESFKILEEFFPLIIFAPVIDYLIVPFKAMRYPVSFVLENLIPFNLPATNGQIFIYALFLLLILIQLKDWKTRVLAGISLYYSFFLLSFSYMLLPDFFLHSVFLCLISFLGVFWYAKKSKAFF